MRFLITSPSHRYSHPLVHSSCPSFIHSFIHYLQDSSVKLSIHSFIFLSIRLSTTSCCNFSCRFTSSSPVSFYCSYTFNHIHHESVHMFIFMSILSSTSSASLSTSRTPTHLPTCPFIRQFTWLTYKPFNYPLTYLPDSSLIYPPDSQVYLLICSLVSYPHDSQTCLSAHLPVDSLIYPPDSSTIHLPNFFIINLSVKPH